MQQTANFIATLESCQTSAVVRQKAHYSPLCFNRIYAPSRGGRKIDSWLLEVGLTPGNRIVGGSSYPPAIRGSSPQSGPPSIQVTSSQVLAWSSCGGIIAVDGKDLEAPT